MGHERWAEEGNTETIPVSKRPVIFQDILGMPSTHNAKKGDVLMFGNKGLEFGKPFKYYWLMHMVCVVIGIYIARLIPAPF